MPLQKISIDVIEKSEISSTSFSRKIWNRLHEHSGIWYMLSANILFACATFSLKLIPADMFDIMIVRFLIQSVVFGSYAAFYKHYNIFNTNGQPLATTLNILMSSGTNLTYLAAFYFLPLSDLNAIKYTYIVWTAILSVIFLKDRFKCVNSIALILTIIGAVFATKPEVFINTFTNFFNQSTISVTTIAPSTTIVPSTTSSPYYYIGVILAFISSWTKAIQMIARKQLVKTKQPYSVMNFQFTIFALFVAFSYSIIRRYWQPGPYPWKWMGTVGVIMGCIQLITNTFYAKALKRENVQLLSIISTLDILYACVLQYIFLRITKSLMFYIGASFIVISTIIISIDSHLTHKKERKQQKQQELINQNQPNNV